MSDDLVHVPRPGEPGFDLDVERALDVEHREGVGTFSKLSFGKNRPYSARDERGHLEYPKCVVIGKFNGIAISAEHEAQLIEKHEPRVQAPPPAGSIANAGANTSVQPPRAPAPPAQNQSRH